MKCLWTNMFGLRKHQGFDWLTIAGPAARKIISRKKIICLKMTANRICNAFPQKMYLPNILSENAKPCHKGSFLEILKCNLKTIQNWFTSGTYITKIIFQGNIFPPRWTLKFPYCCKKQKQYKKSNYVKRSLWYPSKSWRACWLYW